MENNKFDISVYDDSFLDEMCNNYIFPDGSNPDKELIKQLQEDILVKEQALKKAAEDMKFYKLELINRE